MVARTTFLGLALLVGVFLSAPMIAAGGAIVVVLDLAEAIGPASGDYLHRSLQTARERDARLIVIRLDTPGGLDTSMRDIIRDIIASPVPVVVFVAPSGARAASAGTYILYAAHIAAMAPGTNLGAATPIAIGGLPEISPPEKSPDGSDEKEPETEEKGDKKTLEAKMVNDAVAYIRSLAQLRGRNAEWAEKAVREAASLSAEEALAGGVVDYMASDLEELLEVIHGQKVEVLGHEVEIDTSTVAVETIEPDWRSRLLSVITNPNIAYVLMLLGIYGLIFELANPGYVLPGVVGGICLVLALFAFQVLPVNYAGVALVALGIAFMVSELFVPSFGALGIGGAVAFVIGSIILFDTDQTGYTVSTALVATIGLLSAGFMIFVLAMARRIHLRPVVSGMEEMVGMIGLALDDFDGSGRVRTHGEVWQAYSDKPVKRDQQVRVRAVEGLTLHVEPAREDN